uniref:ATP synthase complex subunit 8 n=1 Tax=Anoplophora chinensis TaxID=217632 RepID=A0A0U2VTR5_ANOCN|nr:ATP synthase F0 subunit 8 [Anoplophora chinensis]ALS54020.1 ATP synthase F0 subunit 8 [Anoplophora chinensis]UNB14369.1 ATP synthase F0 subunit 8 [Anoplophora chinensis]
MPQMAPLNWLILYLYFLMIFFIFNIINFYSFNYNIKFSKKSKSSLIYNWKW